VLENSQKFICNTEEIKQAIQCGKSFATKFHYSILIENNKNNDLASVNEHHQLRFFFQEPNHGNIESYVNDYHNNIFDFSVEVNVLYLWDAIMAINSKQCLLLINTINNFLFIIPWSGDKDIENVKNNYDEAHLIMCLR
jgi:DNA polymerase III sliding clamp (beta) subunit (PCNA family)